MRHLTLGVLPSIFIAGSLGLTSCGKTLVFGERTALDLSVAVNPTRAAPLEVNFGLDRKVVSVVPPRLDPTDQVASNGEAVNMFAGFKVHYDPGQSPLTGRMQVRAQFASGGAAIEVANDPETVNRIVNVSRRPIATSIPEQIVGPVEELSTRITEIRKRDPDQMLAIAKALNLMSANETLTPGRAEGRIRVALNQASGSPADFAAFKARFNKAAGS